MNKPSLAVTIASCVASVCLVLSTGCNSAGKAFNVDNVRLIEKGTTTKSDVRDYFGDPLRREVGLYGEVWTYTYMDSRATPIGVIGAVTIGVDQAKTDVNKLKILFEDDTVKDFEYSSSSRMDSYLH